MTDKQETSPSVTRKRKIIHHALENIASVSWLALMSDMGDVLGGHTPLEESVAHLVTARLVLEADGEVVLAIM